MVMEGSEPGLIEALILNVSAVSEEIHETLTHDIRCPDKEWNLNHPSYGFSILCVS
jgi:hypothetical protein